MLLTDMVSIELYRSFIHYSLTSKCARTLHLYMLLIKTVKLLYVKDKAICALTLYMYFNGNVKIAIC